MHAAMATKSLSLHGLPSPTAKKLSSSFLGAPASFLRPPALAATATPSRRTLAVRAMAPPKPGGKPKKVVGIIKLALEAGKATPAPPVGPALGAKGVNSMASTAVSTASLPLPRRVSPTAAAHRPKAPSLRKRHCAVRPVAAASNPTRQPTANVEGSGRRHVLVAGAAALLSRPNPAAFAAEAKKGFLPVTDKKDGYSFLYPFGWQEVVVEGQDKVYKDVIEPLESVSVNTIPTSKQDIRELGPPDQVAEALIRKVLAPPTQKTKLIEAKENDVDGRAYYTFEFTAQAPNYTRHALGAIAIANGKFYTLTTGANERRWEKMKDRLHTVVDSFKIENRV